MSEYVWMKSSDRLTVNESMEVVRVLRWLLYGERRKRNGHITLALKNAEEKLSRAVDERLSRNAPHLMGVDGAHKDR